MFMEAYISIKIVGVAKLFIVLIYIPFNVLEAIDTAFSLVDIIF